MQIYLVGGAVRDKLLGLPVHERDWVVVGASEADLLAAGYRRADSQFPVFLHPQTGEEYALARTEVKTGPGYKGFEVHVGPEVTLEQDLLRRDLTINALAEDACGELIDVCGGREDLDQGLLRHITPAFSEDPVRLLRIARFAAKLGRWGFRVAHGTHALMKKMARSDDLLSLRPERIWREMRKAMGEPQPWRFFEVLHGCGALQRLLPELAGVMGEGGHGATAPAKAMAALRRVSALSSDYRPRLAVALYAATGRTPDPDDLIRRLTLERELAQRLHDLLALAPGLLANPGTDELLAAMRRLRPDRQPARYQDFLLALQALWPAASLQIVPALGLARQVLDEVGSNALRSQGLSGPKLGAAIRRRQQQLLDERLAGLSQGGGPIDS